MAEYIEREAVKAAVRKRLNNSLIIGWLISIVNEVHVADVASVVHGRWLDTGYYGHSKSPIYMCSNCRKEVEDYYIKNHKFCLHCGARMDGE